MSTAEAALPAPAAGPNVDKRAQVEQLLNEIFRLAGWPARLELKDVTDGGIAVAVHFEREVPGVLGGKKSHLIDSLQFLVNKVVNRPNTEKRWVTLGVGGFPEARQPTPVAAAPSPRASAPKGLRASAPRRSAPRASAPKAARSAEPARAEEVEDVAVSPEWKAVAHLLAGKATKHGRLYAVMGLSPADRAQLTKAAQAEKGLNVKVEGDGHFRRVAFVPDKATPMPRKMQFPDYDDDDGEE